MGATNNKGTKIMAETKAAEERHEPVSKIFEKNLKLASDDKK